MITENDPYYTNIMMFSDFLKEGESRHIEIDDRINIFVLCVGPGQFTGWYYYLNGNMPIITFTNSTVSGIVELGYEEGIISSITAGSTYNEMVTSSIMDSINDELLEVPSYQTEKQLDSGSYATTDGSMESKMSYDLDSSAEPISSKQVTVTSDSFGTNIYISKGEQKMSDIFKSFKLGNTAQDYDASDLVKSTDDAVQDYFNKKKDGLAKSLEAPTEADLKKSKGEGMTFYSTNKIVQAAYLESLFKKDDELINFS